jgi:hypothetical protein
MADHRGRTATDADDAADRPGRDVTTHTVEDRAPLGVTETRTTRRPMTGAGSRYDEDDTADVRISEASNLARDRVRWGPILAGLCTALTSLLLLSLLGLAIGLTAVNAGTAAAQGAAPDDAGRNTAIWGAVSALISFFLGGYVAGKTAAVFDRGWGALNGALVFLVAVPVTLWLASMGLARSWGRWVASWAA